MFGNLRAALHGAGLAALMLALSGAAGAQDPVPLRPLGTPGETTLFMMVRAGPNLTEGQLERTLKRGLEKALCTIDGDPNIRPISPAVFEEIELLTNRTASAVGAAPVVDAFGVRRLPTRELLWEFRLKSPAQVLKKLTVTYKKAGAKDYAPTGPQEAGALTLIVPGSYALKLEPNDDPVSYEAEVVELGQDPQKIQNKWPLSDRYYVVTMRNFKGNRERLFKIIQDAREVPNPLDSVRLGSDLVFVFADLESTAARLRRKGIVENRLTIDHQPPEGRLPNRAWILFPLTEGEMKKELESYRKYENEEELAKVIRQNSIRATEDAKVGPASAAKWLELRDLGNGQNFQRVITLNDFQGLHDRYPAVWYLLVWEFDDGKPAAIKVKHPKGGEVLVLEQEIPEWSMALKEKLSSPAPKRD